MEWSSCRAFGEVGWKHGLAVDLPLGIDVDQDFRAGETLLQLLLHPVEAVVRLFNGPIRRHPDMELRELVGAAGPGTEVVQAGQLRIFGRGREKPRPFLL